jgi:hypothetical protein
MLPTAPPGLKAVTTLVVLGDKLIEPTADQRHQRPDEAVM